MFEIIRLSEIRLFCLHKRLRAPDPLRVLSHDSRAKGSLTGLQECKYGIKRLIVTKKIKFRAELRMPTRKQQTRTDGDEWTLAGWSLD